MITKKLTLGVVLVLVAAWMIFGVRSWLQDDSPHETRSAGPVASTAPVTPAAPETSATASPTPSPASPRSTATTPASPTPAPAAEPAVTRSSAPPAHAPATRPKPAKPEEHSTTYIEQHVQTDLDKKSDIDTRVVCPPKSILAVNISLVCLVYDARDAARGVVARVVVKIGGDDGRFTWKSVSLL